MHPTDKSLELDPKIKEAWQQLYQKYSGILGDQADNLTAAVHEAVQKLSE